MEINHWLVDSSVISNFALIGKLELLKEELTEKLCITEEVKSESACLSIAVKRKWKLFTDDIDARNTAQRLEVPVSGTIGLLVYLIHNSHITLTEGNKMLKDMINKGYYSPVEKLDDFLGN